MRYFRTVSILAMLAIGLGLCGIEGNADSTRIDQDKSPLLLDPSSNPHAVISELFFKSGYSTQDSSYLATRCLQRLKGEDVDPTDILPARTTGQIPIDPDSNPHALLFEAYLASGWSVTDATQHANTTAMQILGIEPDPMELNPLGEECWVYPVTLVYCENGLRKRKTHYLNGLCWEGDFAPCIAPACPGTEKNWYTVSIVGGHCSWLSIRSGGTWVPCQWVDLDCEDFESTDCNDLHVQCCHIEQSCDGCPDCS